MYRISLLALLLPSAALAQAPSADARATSAALLSEAKQLTAASKTADACAKYAESYSLDAQLDALLPLAECFEQTGKLASAYGAYRDAVELGQRNNDARAVAAEARASRLRPRLSYLTIDVTQPRRLPALSVERDGFRLGSSAWGVPTPVDPGAHVISARAYGYRDWQVTIVVQGEGAAPYVEVPPLERLPDFELAAPAASAPSAEPAPLPPVVALAPRPVAAAKPVRVAAASPRPRSGLAPTRVAALVAGGVGVGSLGVGVYFLAKANSTLSERDGICPSSRDCAPGTNAHLAELTQQAINQQRAEIAFLAVGGAAIALAAGLWFLPTRKGDAHAAYVLPVLAPTGGALVLGGRL